jgi:probable F420-dependent oxidoreductase
MDLDIGIHLPHVGPIGTRESVLTVARRCEELGFHSLWVSDHVVVPRKISARYPGTADGRFPIPPEFPFLEPVSTLLFVAAATERIKLGTSILVITQRNPVLVAKELATLDVLSEGRLIFGAGAGWLPEEFEALNTSIRGHGPRMAEYLEVIRRCWTEDDPSFEGRYYKLGNVGVYPKPVQTPYPPIWVGGFSDGALRRVARYGDAWHAGGPPQALAQGFARIRELATEYDRDPNSITLSIRGDGLHRGEPEQVIDRLLNYKNAGATHVMLSPAGRTLPELLSRIEYLAENILGKV